MHIHTACTGVTQTDVDLFVKYVVLELLTALCALIRVHEQVHDYKISQKKTLKPNNRKDWFSNLILWHVF